MTVLLGGIDLSSLCVDKKKAKPIISQAEQSDSVTETIASTTDMFVGKSTPPSKIFYKNHNDTST